MFLPQYKVYSGSGERGDHRLHTWIGTTGGQGQERTPVCGECLNLLALCRGTRGQRPGVVTLPVHLCCSCEQEHCEKNLLNLTQTFTWAQEYSDSNFLISLFLLLNPDWTAVTEFTMTCAFTKKGADGVETQLPPPPCCSSYLYFCGAFEPLSSHSAATCSWLWWAQPLTWHNQNSTNWEEMHSCKTASE